MPAVEPDDLTAVLDPAVPQLTRDLADMLTQDLRDPVTPTVLEIITLLVHVHWYRIAGLPEGQSKDDVQACQRWSAVLLPIAPELLPEPVRAILTASDMPGGGTAAEANDRGAALYELYRRTGSIEVL